MNSRRAVVARLLERGVERGELDPGLDIGHAADLLFGPFWYRLFVGHEPLDPVDARAHVARLLDGFRAAG